MDSLLVKVIVQFLYTVLTLFGGGVHTSPTIPLRIELLRVVSKTNNRTDRLKTDS